MSRLNSLSKKEVSFFIPYSIWLFIQTLSVSFFYQNFSGYYYNRIFYACLLFLLFRELFFLKSINYKEIVAGIIVVILMYSLYEFGRDAIMATVFIIFCMRNIDYRKIIYVSLIVISFAFILIIASSQLDIILDFIEYNPTRIRHYLGFRYSLFGPTIYFNIVAACIFLRRNDFSIYGAILLLLINFYLYKMTDSRLAFVLTFALIFIGYLSKYIPDSIKSSKYVYLLFFSSIFLSIFISFIITYFYSPNNELLVKLNHILGNRLELGNQGLKNFRIEFLGQNINFTGNGLDMYGHKSTSTYNYIDNFYLHYLIQHGIFFMSILVGSIAALFIRLKKTNEYYLALILSFFCLHGIIDDLMLPLYYNLFFAPVIYLTNGEKKEDLSYSLFMLIILLVMAFYIFNRFFVTI